MNLSAEEIAFWLMFGTISLIVANSVGRLLALHLNRRDR